MIKSAADNQTSSKRTLRERLFDYSSQKIGKERTRFFFNVYDLTTFDLFGKPKGVIGTIDITNRCNLHCKRCCFHTRDSVEKPELSDEEWIEKLEHLKETPFPFYQCSWTGGEPLLRRELLEHAIKYFQSNLIATNGTIELPDWPDVNFYVSVDGKKDTHDALRGTGTHDRIKKNLNRQELKIIVSMVIHKKNYQEIEYFLEEWKDTGIKTCLFQIHTPAMGLHNDEFWPGWRLRDKILDTLIRLKEEKYGDFIGVPSLVLNLMKSDRCKEVTWGCIFKELSFCLDSQGQIKRPCMMGPHVDCLRCGCVLPFHLWALEGKCLMLRELFMTTKRRMNRKALR
ncbi:MAG: radical SAM protein [Candidatus Brocadiaceae bacterium]|nr:radical SAM protein [Candidatus Brocadiaceae bacterium]